MRTSSKCSLAVLLLTAACSSAGPTADPTSSSSPPADPAPARAVVGGSVAAAPIARLARPIRTDEASVVSVETSRPWASCKLDAVDATDATEALAVYADDEGVVRFHARPTDPRATISPMRLDCADEAGTFSYAVDLVVDANAPHAQTLPPPKGRLRPALAEDPMSLTPEELIARGFPPRPDPTTEPAHYAAWLELASHPVTTIEPHLMPSERVHGPHRAPAANVEHASGSPNWAGVVLRQPGVQYQWIFGSWNVPSTKSEGGFWSTTYLSDWVGLDGETTADVVQAGTEEDTSSRVWVSSWNDYAWTEFFPAGSNVVANFPVNAGDQIDTWVWMTDANGNYNVNGGYGSFMLYNATQYVLSNAARIKAPAGITFTGANAEWVAERPTVNGSYYDLTTFSQTNMSQAYARDAKQGFHDFSTDAFDTWWITDSSGNVMAACWPGQPENMAFDFYRNN